MADKPSKDIVPQIRSQGKIFDMVPPDQTMPSPSGRPILVTHRAMVRDPMVSKDTKSEVPARAATLIPEEIARQEDESADQPAVKDSSNSSNTRVEEPALEEQQITPEDDPQAESDEGNIAGVGSLPITHNKKASDDEQAKRVAEAEALIASKKYFVPINAVRRRRWKQLLAILVLVVLVGAAVYYVMRMAK